MTNLNRLALLGICILLDSCAIAPPPTPHTIIQGDTLFSQGKFSAALLAWQSAENTVDSTLLLRQARAYQALGQTRDARYFAEAALDHANPSQYGEVCVALVEIAMMQGLKQQALQYLQQAKQVTLNPYLAVQIASVEGRMALIDKQPEQALAHYTNAQRLAIQTGDSLLKQEMAVNRWGVIHQLRISKASPKAMPQIATFTADELMVLQKTVNEVTALPASAGKDFISIKLARLLLSLPDQDTNASLLLSDAALSSQQREDQRLLSYALGYQGLLAEQQHHDDMALNFTAQAAFAAQQASAPESLYLWEWQSARIRQRQNMSTEALAAYRRAVFNLQSVRTDIGAGSAFREKVAPLFIAFSDLLLKQAHIETDAHRIQMLLLETRALLEQLKAAELQDYFQDRCVANFKAKSIGLEEITQHTAVLYPVLLPDRTELLVEFADGLRQFVIPVGNEQLNDEIHDFRKKLEKRTTFQYLRPARQLYHWLISPILAELHQHQIDTLVIVPDGALRNIPLAALNDDQRYLIEEFAVATTPGLSLTDPHALPAEHLQVLLTGLTEPVQQFPGLPNVAMELDYIHSQYGGTILKDSDFRLTTMAQTMEDTHYRIVHIASHGQFDQNPNKTFVLTYDNKLTMDLLERYISIGKFRDEPVELLTLSACQTAVGDDRAALGLAGVAVKAGARSALASLWFINDQSSSHLVRNFYQQLKMHQTKAGALQKAQLEMLNDPRYRHASYWAPFLIIGNWL